MFFESKMPSDAWLVLEVMASNTTYCKSGAAVFASVAPAGSGGSPARKWLRNMRSVQRIAQRWIYKTRHAGICRRCSSFWECNTWSLLDIGTPAPNNIYYNVVENFWTVCVISNSDPGVVSVSRLLVLRLCHLDLLEYTETFEASLTCLPTLEEVEHSFGGSEPDADITYNDTAIFPAMDWPDTSDNADMETIELGWKHVERAVDRLPECLRSIALLSFRFNAQHYQNNAFNEMFRKITGDDR